MSAQYIRCLLCFALLMSLSCCAVAVPSASPARVAKSLELARSTSPDRWPTVRQQILSSLGVGGGVAERNLNGLGQTLEEARRLSPQEFQERESYLVANFCNGVDTVGSLQLFDRLSGASADAWPLLRDATAGDIVRQSANGPDITPEHVQAVVRALERARVSPPKYLEPMKAVEVVRSTFVRRLQWARRSFIPFPRRIAQLVRKARRASPSRWPAVRCLVRAQLILWLVENGESDMPLDVAIKHFDIILARLRAMSDAEYARRRSELIRKTYHELALRHCIQAEALTVASGTPKEDWASTRLDLMNLLSSVVETRGAAKDRQDTLERAASVLDVAQRGWRGQPVKATEFAALVHNLDAAMRRDWREGPYAAVAKSNAVWRQTSGVPLAAPDADSTPNTSASTRLWMSVFLTVFIVASSFAMGRLRRRFKPPLAIGRRCLWTAACAVWLVLCLEAGARVLLSSNYMLDLLSSRDSASMRIHFVRAHDGMESMEVNPMELMVYDSQRGWAMRPNLRDRTMSPGWITNTNARGIRGQEDYPYERTPNTTRIVTLGDSYTFGFEVNDDESYSSHLAGLVNAEVLNLGVPGYGHDQMLLYLQQEGVKYHPNVVILGYLRMDKMRNSLPFSFAAKPTFELAAGRLELRGVPVPDLHSILDNEIYRSSLFDLASMMGSRYRASSGTRENDENDLTEAIVSEMDRVCRENGSTLVVAYLPQNARELNGQIPTDAHFVEDVCLRHHIHFRDVSPALKAGMSTGTVRRIQRMPRHFNSSESNVIAQDLREYLREQGLVGPRPAPRFERSIPMSR